MKKIIAILGAAAVIAAAVLAGYAAGKQHVIMHQQLWIMDFDQPDDAHDVTIYADIDGQWHEYGGYIG